MLAVSISWMTLTWPSVQAPGLQPSELQLHRTIVSAHSAMMWLPAISIFESWPIRNVTTPAMMEQAASSTRPSVVSPVVSLIQPMAYGPTKPPRLLVRWRRAVSARAFADHVHRWLGRGVDVLGP